MFQRCTRTNKRLDEIPERDIKDHPMGLQSGTIGFYGYFLLVVNYTGDRILYRL